MSSRTSLRLVPSASGTLAALLLAAALFAQDPPERLGEIEFFGYFGIPLQPIRAALPLHEGDTIDLPQAQNQIKQSIRQSTGQEPSDVAMVCCDNKGQWMIYIGLRGRSNREFRYNAAPQGPAKLPASALKLYQRFVDANMESVQKGQAGEDDSKGYALSEYPPFRAIQLETRKYAVQHEPQIERVLETSADVNQRRAAAEFLGYAQPSDAQLAGLAHAARDPDSDVRNNAIRALGVLARFSPKVAAQIPASEFIAMLNSGSWSDRNKCGLLMLQLTASRDPKLLGELRNQAFESLIEMARWRSPGHSASYRMIVGRIAGIEEKTLEDLVEQGKIQAIFEALGLAANEHK